MESGVFVNCGNYRPRWLRTKCKRATIHFGFSLEVPANVQTEAAKEIHEAVHAMVASWSRSCWVKLQKEKDKRKKEKSWQK